MVGTIDKRRAQTCSAAGETYLYLGSHRCRQPVSELQRTNQGDRFMPGLRTRIGITSRERIRYQMITKAEWLIDVENTEKEFRAYSLLSEGFEILANLPENSGGKASLYHHKARAYASSHEGCGKFLGKLKKLKEFA